MVPWTEDPRDRARGARGPDRPVRADHALARGDAHRRHGDGARGLPPAAADRRRHHVARPHRGQDRSLLQRAGGARARRVARRGRRGRADEPRGTRPLRGADARRVRGGAARRTRAAPRTERRLSLAEARAQPARDRLVRRDAAEADASWAFARFENFPLAELVERIDWTPFFSTWELAGRYPEILADPVVGDAAHLAVRGRAGDAASGSWTSGVLRANGVVGFWPAASTPDDDIELYADESRSEVVGTLPHPAPADGQVRQGVGEAERGTGRLHGPEGLGRGRLRGRIRRDGGDRPGGGAREVHGGPRRLLGDPAHGARGPARRGLCRAPA